MASAELSGNVHVALRVRPAVGLDPDLDNVVDCEDDGRVHITSLNSSGVENTKSYRYNHALGPATTQQDVFDALGQGMVDDALHGYNVCLFAFGQVGAGKTHTMVGNSDDRGMVFRVCEELVRQCQKKQISFELSASALEIYNENVRDLLTEKASEAKQKMRVREHPETGPFVEGLTSHQVGALGSIAPLIDLAESRRTTKAMEINERSHRGHCIYTLHLKQFGAVNGLMATKSSVINFVDLAGIERLGSAQTIDESRLREDGSNNKSLVFFGKCLTALADRNKPKSSSKSSTSAASGGDGHIPYRDSNLTWLLKESLGGNAKTYMVATLSPAGGHVRESMSTLLYALGAADRAKKIITKPMVNEIRNTEEMRALEAEVARLQRALKLLKDRAARGKPDTTNAACNTEARPLHITACTIIDIPSDTNLYEELEGLRHRCESQESDLQTLQQLVDTAESKCAELEAAIKNEQQRFADANHEHQQQLLHRDAEIAKHLAALEEQKNAFAEQTASHNHDLSKATEALRRAEAKIAQLELEHEMDIQARDGNTAALEESAQRRAEALRSQVALLEGQMSTLGLETDEEIARLKAALDRKQQQIVSAEGTLQQIVAAKDEMYTIKVGELDAKIQELAACEKSRKELEDRWKRELQFFKNKFLSVWDSKANCCQGCSVTFTMVSNRRHHCRVCGQAFCAQCCADRVMTSSSKKPVRACRECNAFLNVIEKDLASLEETLEQAAEQSNVAAATFVAYD